MIVDSHCHVIPSGMLTGAVPDDWRPVIRRENGKLAVSFQGRRLNSVTSDFADVSATLAHAAATGITHVLISPWILLVPVSARPGDAVRICRVQNESLSQAATAEPDGRVRALGAVPLQDPALAAAELEQLMTLPGIAGVEVPASVGGRYVGEDTYTPFWEAAAGTGALVFVHPTTTGLGLPALKDHYLWNSIGNPVETAIAAAQLVSGGMLERCPSLTVLLAHGGGALLGLRGRLRRAYAVRPEARSAATIAPDYLLRSLYFDSLTHDRAVLADLIAFAGANHVLLGTDWPFDMGTDKPVEEIAALGLAPDDEQLILGGNAARLLPPVPDE